MNRFMTEHLTQQIKKWFDSGKYFLIVEMLEVVPDGELNDELSRYLEYARIEMHLNEALTIRELEYNPSVDELLQSVLESNIR